MCGMEPVVRSRRPLPQHSEAFAGGGGAGSGQWEILASRIRDLWELHGIPVWHRDLYEAKYLNMGPVGARYHPEFLQQEVHALQTGTAVVQAARRSIQEREEVLSTLRAIRLRHTDEELQAPKSVPARNLLGMLCQLRAASVCVVEALSAWRQAVSPVPGRRRGDPEASPRSKAQLCASTTAMSVAGPGARGASWPSGPDGEDYLCGLLRDQSVVQPFSAVVAFASNSSQDPFILGATAAGLLGCGKLTLPPPERQLAARIEVAKLILVEQELATATLEASRSRMGMVQANNAKTSPTGLTLPSQVADLLRPCRSQALSPKRKPIPDGDIKKPNAGLAATDTASRRPFVVRRPRSALPASRQRKRGRPVSRAQQQQEDGLPRSEQQTSESLASAPASSRGSQKCKNGHETPRRRASLSLAEQAKDFLEAQVAAGQDITGLEMMATTPAGDAQAAKPQEVPAVIAVFKRLQHDWTLHHDDMEKALRLLGVLDPAEEWIDEVWRAVSTYSTIGLEEFVQVVSGYDARERRALKETFEQFDADGSGSIQGAELAEVLKDLSLEPMHHVLAEIISEVDHDGSGEIELEEFFEVMHSLQERQGFALSEYKALLDAFEKFDVDHSGEVDGQELAAILNYLGYNTSQNVAESIVKEVGSGNVGVTEFLVCMRHVRDKEVEKLKSSMKAFGRNSGGGVSLGVPELEALLHSLQYFPEMDVISEVCHEIGLDMGTNAWLDLSGLWQFLHVYRKREGLSLKDDQDLRSSFLRYAERRDRDGSPSLARGDLDGEVSVHNVGKVLRYMGFIIPFEEQQLLIHAVDVDKSGSLSLVELRKIVRMCRQRELLLQKALFEQLDVDGNGSLSAEEVEASVQSGLLEKWALGGLKNSRLDGLDLAGFMRISRVASEKAKQAIRSSGGFTREELARLKESFLTYDRDHSGDICNAELINLIEDVFPDMASSPQMRPILDSIVREADMDNNGRLDFEDFCRLMRACFDLREKQHLAKERQTILQTGFSQHEVNEFRELFVGVVGERQDIKVFEFKRMIASVLQLSDEKAVELVILFHEVVPDSDQATFGDFLLLMHRVLDVNFGGIKERTAAHAAALQKNSPIAGETSATPSSRRRRSATASPSDVTRQISHVNPDSMAEAIDDLGSHNVFRHRIFRHTSRRNSNEDNQDNQ